MYWIKDIYCSGLSMPGALCILKVFHLEACLPSLGTRRYIDCNSASCSFYLPERINHRV